MQLSAQDRLVFTKHLGLMLKSGISIAEAIAVLKDQTDSPQFKKILKSVAYDISNGQSLSNALQKYPKAFDHFYTNLIKISEESGTLDENLDFLAQQLEKDLALQKKIQSALLYPGLVFFTATIMGGFISLFVLPKLVDFFENFDVALPVSTQILLFVATTMKNHGISIIGGITILFFLFTLVIQLPKIKPIWHKIVLRLPFFGKLIMYSQLAVLLRSFGVLIKSGIPISHSLEISARTLSNVQFQNDLLEVASFLEKGKSMSYVLEKKNYFEYPPLVVKMLGVGEKTGKLDETLLYLGDYFEGEIDNVTKNLTTVLEPILLLGVGLIVGFIALAIISPIYELSGSLR